MKNKLVINKNINPSLFEENAYFSFRAIMQLTSSNCLVATCS